MVAAEHRGQTTTLFEDFYFGEEMPGPSFRELSKAHNHIKNFGFAPYHPEPKNPISLLLEVGQKLHVTPRYFVTKSKESSVYTCKVHFYGYRAKSSSNWKKVSKQEAAKDLLDQIVYDATRKERKTSELLNFMGGSLKKQTMIPGSRMNQNPHLDGTMQYLQFPGAVHYISFGKEYCRVACKEIRQSSDGPVICGFDIEWKPNFEKGQNNKTAVIQICPSEEDCYIFHISSFRYIPTSLKHLLEDDDIIKAGLGIRGDVSKIHSDFGIRLANAVDLSDMYNKVSGSSRVWGIKSLLQQLLNKSKDDSKKLSNWEDFPLTKAQLMYAATDAYAGLVLYKKIKKMPGGRAKRDGSLRMDGYARTSGNTTSRRRNRNGRVSGKFERVVRGFRKGKRVT